MSLNSRQRARWIADMVAELQRFIAKAATDVELPHAQRALEALQDGRRAALEDGARDQ